MGTVPPAELPAPGDVRVPIYRLALELSRQLFAIIDLTEGVERIYLRDTLDKRSSTIPLLIARALSTTELTNRRGIFEAARTYATECEVILDVLDVRGTIESRVLAPAILTARDLRDKLAVLTAPPPRPD